MASGPITSWEIDGKTVETVPDFILGGSKITADGDCRDTCTPMFITALFIIARTWKQPRCPSADEWIRKLWYIYTMEYYSVIKKNTFESVLMRWMKLEPIIQNKVSQKEKHQYSILMHILEKAMAPHSSTLAWKIPWMEEPGGLQSMGSLGVGHD